MLFNGDFTFVALALAEYSSHPLAVRHVQLSEKNSHQLVVQHQPGLSFSFSSSVHHRPPEDLPGPVACSALSSGQISFHWQGTP